MGMDQFSYFSIFKHDDWSIKSQTKKLLQRKS